MNLENAIELWTKSMPRFMDVEVGQLEAWQLICDKARIGDMLENIPNQTGIYRLADPNEETQWMITRNLKGAKSTFHITIKEALESLIPKEPELLPCPFTGDKPFIEQ